MTFKSFIIKAGCAAAILFAGFLVLIIALIYPFFRINRPPPITNARALVQDCQTLVEQYSDGLLEYNTNKVRFTSGVVEAQWPATVAALKPRALYVSKDRVIILISTGGIDASYGYVVPYLTVTNFTIPRRGRRADHGVRMTKTKYPNVYYWSGIE